MMPPDCRAASISRSCPCLLLSRLSARGGIPPARFDQRDNLRFGASTGISCRASALYSFLYANRRNSRRVPRVGVRGQANSSMLCVYTSSLGFWLICSTRRLPRGSLPPRASGTELSGAQTALSKSESPHFTADKAELVHE